MIAVLEGRQLVVERGAYDVDGKPVPGILRRGKGLQAGPLRRRQVAQPPRPDYRVVGPLVAVPGAPMPVRDAADYVTDAGGGRGAVREVVDLVLKSAGLYVTALERLGDRAWHPTRAELSSDAHGGRTP